MTREVEIRVVTSFQQTDAFRDTSTLTRFDDGSVGAYFLDDKHHVRIWIRIPKETLEALKE